MSKREHTPMTELWEAILAMREADTTRQEISDQFGLH